MRHLSSARRRRALALVVITLALGSGYFATMALAATDTYCSFCIVGSVPAVSGVAYHTTNFMGSHSGPANLHIYLYNASTGNQTCDGTAHPGPSVYRECANNGTARCHTYDGWGQIYATCLADY